MHIAYNVQLSFANVSDINVNVLYHNLHFQTNYTRKLSFRLVSFQILSMM